MRRLLPLILFTLASHSFADARSQLSQYLKALDSLQGQFEQTLTSREGKPLQTTQGQFTIKRPGYFLWDTQAPNEQLVVGNPQKLWVYDPDLEQVTVRSQASQGDNSPARLLSGNIDSLAPNFDISQNTQANSQVFTLKPKKPANENFSQMEFSFQNGQITGMAFTDKLGQITRLQLKNTQANQPVDLKQFTFEPKPGTSIIEND